MSDLLTFSNEAIALTGLTCLVLREIILAAIPTYTPATAD